jgi:NitT/TauT family transport system substrate-binding protein
MRAKSWTIKFVIGFLTIFGLAAWGDQCLVSDAFAQEKVSMRFQWKVGSEHAGFIVAKEKGFYQQEGLDVTLKEGMGLGSTGVLKLLGAKEETFGLVALNTSLKGVVNGVPVMQVMVIQLTSNGILLRPDSGIKTPQDLIGKSIAGSGSGVSDIFIAFLGINNVPVDQVKYVAGGSAYLQTMVTGKTHGALANVLNDMNEVKKMGMKEVNSLLFTDWGVPPDSYAVAVHTDTIGQNPEMIRKFVRASLKGIKAMLANVEEAADISKKHFPMVDRDGLLANLRNLKAFEKKLIPETLGWQDPKAVEGIRDMAAKYDKLPQAKDMPPSKFFTNDFLPKN